MKKTIGIEGMSCGHCVSAVHEALSALEGVQVEDVAIGRAEVQVDEGSITDADIEQALRNAGYEPLSMETT